MYKTPAFRKVYFQKKTKKKKSADREIHWTLLISPSCPPSAILTSVGIAGDDFEARSSNLAESRSFLAASTGPKTFCLRRDLLAFFVLARSPLAIVVVY